MLASALYPNKKPCYAGLLKFCGSFDSGC